MRYEKSSILQSVYFNKVTYCFSISSQEHAPVKAIPDQTQIQDVRVLQNLLRNEERFMPMLPDYMNTFQPMIEPHMRKTVADWMLEIVHEQNSQPDVFCLAMNIMDRLLCQIQLHKDQFQLLAAVCVLIASKIREPCPILGKSLIVYTDYSITAEEMRVKKFLIFKRVEWSKNCSKTTKIDHCVRKYQS